MSDKLEHVRLKIMAISKNTLHDILPSTASIAVSQNCIICIYTLECFSITVSVVEQKTILNDKLVILIEAYVKCKLLPRPIYLLSKNVNVSKVEDIVCELNVTKAILDSLAILIHDNQPEAVSGWLMKKRKEI